MDDCLLPPQPHSYHAIHPQGGAASALTLSPRIAIGPELLFIGGENHTHTVLTGNVTVDFIASFAAPSGSGGWLVRP